MIRSNRDKASFLCGHFFSVLNRLVQLFADDHISNQYSIYDFKSLSKFDIINFVRRGGTAVGFVPCDWTPEGRRFESHSSRHVGTLGKSFTCSCL